MDSDYPIDLRADRPARSSRGWAVLTIFLIKFIALIPHWVVLFFLFIAQGIVALIAQVVVAVKGEYPAGMYEFVAGVLRWNTRVSAFVLSLTDRYPPFTLRPDAAYPVDVLAERPTRSNRLYALLTIIVEVVVIVGVIWLVVRATYTVHATEIRFSNGTTYRYNYSPSSPSGGWSGLILRDLAALPHLIVLLVLGIAAFVVWVIVQWVILFTASFPKGMYDFVAGVLRWETRVGAYTLGLIDRYPPFTFDASLAAASGGPAVPGGPQLPPPPPPMAPLGPASEQSAVPPGPPAPPPSAGTAAPPADTRMGAPSPTAPPAPEPPAPEPPAAHPPAPHPPAPPSQEGPGGAADSQ